MRQTSHRVQQFYATDVACECIRVRQDEEGSGDGTPVQTENGERVFDPKPFAAIGGNPVKSLQEKEGAPVPLGRLLTRLAEKK